WTYGCAERLPPPAHSALQGSRPAADGSYQHAYIVELDSSTTATATEQPAGPRKIGVALRYPTDAFFSRQRTMGASLQNLDLGVKRRRNLERRSAWPLQVPVEKA